MIRRLLHRRRNLSTKLWTECLARRNTDLALLRLQVADLSIENLRLERECAEWHRSAMHFKELSDALRGEPCTECGQPKAGPHLGTCSQSLMRGGPGCGALGGASLDVPEKSP